jgi:malate dehydrogenase
MCIISNPVNSTVPIVAEVFKKHGVYDPKRIFGVTTLDLVRASTFTSELVSTLKPHTAVIPVVGGHSGVTILPLLSQVAGTDALSEEQIKALTNRIQFGGDEVVKAKAGAGSATLSMAYAGARFTNSILEAIAGKSVSEYTYVNLEADPENCGKIKDIVGGLDYFSVRVELGPKGVQKLHPIGDLSAYEKTLLEAAVPELKANIENGVNFIQGAKL